MHAFDNTPSTLA